MHETIKAVRLEHIREAESESRKLFTLSNAEITCAFHESFPEYQPTPLINLANLAHELGVNSFYVKDESYRFGLNAFKSLGGSFCLGKYIAEKLECNISELSYEKITSPDIKSKLGEITFVTATDGNHGRGIAWAANRLGHKAVVYMPSGTVAERLNNIRKLGADASITEFNYDNTVRFAAESAKKFNWVLVQDTSWPGYEKIPGWIMQGYLTMALESVQQLEGVVPTHIFLQAGVGSMAGALAAFFADYYRDNKPLITIIEPNKADCIYRTARANDGTLHTVKGSMSTIMAGLACGEPCTIAWDMLRRYAEVYISMPDYVAAKGMRILGNPSGSDTRIISGESGASTSGFVCELMQNESLDYLRELIKIDSDSKILCFSTEGDTDRKNYYNIVWDGLYPSF
ncbi:MAG: diaminopropionate ammonia-lyase [Synergistaceae bacterium]|nr:diaminopropionate ammonia-lyase [Synergistaceae bacterium]